MFGQYNFNLQTCDELEIRRLLWTDGMRPELGVGVTSSATTDTDTATAYSHSSEQQTPPPTFPLVTTPSDRDDHHHHQQRQLSPSGHLGAQYNATSSPGQNQRVSFIPQHIFPGQDMMPYDLWNKASSQQQQHLSESVIPSPQGNQGRGRTTEPPMPSMPNIFTPNQTYFVPVLFQQLQEAHSWSSTTPPNPKPRKNRLSRNDQEIPDDTPESINAAKIGDFYQCSKCRKQLKNENNFRKHIQWHRQKESERSSGQDKRKRVNSGITGARSKCLHCTEFFEDKDKLKNHEISVHKSIVCVDCHQLIPEAEFSQHKKKHLIQPPNWKCHVCSTSFDIYKSFKEHLQTHLAEPYKEPSQDFLTRKVPTAVPTLVTDDDSDKGRFSESDSDSDFLPEVDLGSLKRRVRRSGYSSAATHDPDNSRVREEDIELVDLED